MLLGEMDFSVQPIHQSPAPDSLFVCFQDGKVLLQNQYFPTWREAAAHCPRDFMPFELAHTAGRVLFSPHPFQPVAVPEWEGTAYHSVQVFRHLPYRTGGLLTGCWHLWSWYQTHRFCGVCGHALEPDHQERALRCPGCGHISYPVICPAVITAITCGDQILLVRGLNRPHYGLVAGYMEVGESAETAARREALEEVGLELRNLRYVGDQPWGITGSHMFAFCAEADASLPIRLQQSELADALWVRRDQLEPCDRPVSVAAELIERFRLGNL